MSLSHEKKGWSMKRKISNLIKKSLVLTMALSQILICTNTISTSAAQTSTSNESKVVLNQENISTFINDYFTTNMEKYKVPGAAVSVVKDSKEIFKAGYGFSNLETSEPVIPDSTTFPAGSVSKLFTASAIMKLYQEGKIDLNENIQTYLDDIRIQNPFNEPVTCNNLLTHSSGLDESSELNGSTLDENEIKSQQYYFDIHIPKVIVEPNTLCRYSNMGYNLLGYVIEKVSGMSYEDYIKSNILSPLNMDNSSVRMNNSSMATGYAYDNGKFLSSSLAYQYTSGSSGIISTVTDMENFMIMHLNNGEYNNNSVLNENTEKLMQARHFGNNDIFAGMGYGFIRSDTNGVEILKHEGALPGGYTTTMLLIPGQNFGIYVATNSVCGMVFDFEDAFLNYFYGNTEAATPNSSNGEINCDTYTGTYRSYDGLSEKNIMKIGILFDETVDLNICKTSKNTLQLSEYSQSQNKEESALFYYSNNVFSRQDGKGYITLKDNSHGRVQYAFNDISHKTFEKIGIFENRNVLIATIIIITLLFIISIFIIIIKAIRHKLYKNRRLYAFIVLCQSFFVIGSVGAILITIFMINAYDYSGIGILRMFLTMIILAIFFMICCVIYTIGCIIKKNFSKIECLIVVVLILSQITFTIVLNYFNMIGYNIY